MDTRNTSNNTNSAIFNKLDDLFIGTYNDGDSFNAPALTSFGRNESAEAKAISANTSDKAYRRLTAHENVTSYSLLSLLHTCPRKYELEKLKANADSGSSDDIVNLDFAFGHAVGSGIQTYAATKNITAALLACWLSWKAPWEAEKIDKRGHLAGKSLTWACYAVERFAYWYEENLGDWEVVILPSGKKAVELAFAVDSNNGFYYFGHIDTVLRHKVTGQLAVWEGKTTGFENIDEALYANSNQALGYSVVVDAIAKELGSTGTDYEVLYIVYSSKSREFQLLPFGKSRTQRADWLQDILLDHSNLATYKTLSFYPKRGENCFDGRFNSRCQWFGTCNMQNSSIFPGVNLKTLNDVHGIEALDFTFTLAELVAAQTSN